MRCHGSTRLSQLYLYVIVSSIMLLCARGMASAQESAIVDKNVPPAAQPSQEEKDLIIARKDNEAAQAKYYNKQFEILNKTPGTSAFSKDNIPFLSLIFTAIVTVGSWITFRFTYRASLRSQADTQFYEALKRLSDKDSPASRATAAGLLSQMASPNSLMRIWRKKSPYLRIALDQLFAALQMDESPVSLKSIKAGIDGISVHDLTRAREKAAEGKADIEKEFVRLSTAYCVLAGQDPKGGLKPKHWEDLRKMTGYSEDELKQFIPEAEPAVQDSLDNADREIKSTDGDVLKEYKFKVIIGLRAQAARLRTINSLNLN